MKAMTKDTKINLIVTHCPTDSLFNVCIVSGRHLNAVDLPRAKFSKVPGSLVGLLHSDLLPPPHTDPANPILDHWIYHWNPSGNSSVHTYMTINVICL
jgi:hypothetical protein